VVSVRNACYHAESTAVSRDSHILLGHILLHFVLVPHPSHRLLRNYPAFALLFETQTAALCDSHSFDGKDNHNHNQFVRG